MSEARERLLERLVLGVIGLVAVACVVWFAFILVEIAVNP